MDGRDNGIGGSWPACTVSASDTQPRSSQRHGCCTPPCALSARPMTMGLFPNRRSRQRGITRVRTRWRDAANVAAARWEVSLDAETEVRGFAFASYVAALDAEEAAATEPAACRSIVFIAGTSILAPRSDREERRLSTRWRTHAPCRLPPAGRTRRQCAAAPWVSSRSSSARICFSSASQTRLRLTCSPQPGHVPRSPAHEKRQPQKQATSISDCLPLPAVAPADASFGL